MEFEVEGRVLTLNILDDAAYGQVVAAFAGVREAVLATDWGGMDRQAAELAQCEMIFTCFDAVFGDGTAALIFGERCTAERAICAFEQLAGAVCAQRARLEAASRDAARQYGPERAVVRSGL